MKNFYKILFMSTMIIGTLIAISASSWLTTWIGLEINLLSIIPLMKNHKNKYSTEASIKYFIVQAMASSILLFSIIVFSNMNLLKMDLSIISSLMIDSALLLKLGAAPFHWWLPEVVSGLNWETNYILMTWQKIAPMIILTYTHFMPLFLSIIIIISSMLSGFQGFNQTCLRKILAYSSINHVSWMIASILNSFTTWFYYFITYCIINLNIILMFNFYNMYLITQLSKFLNFNKNMKFFFMLNFLSLGGLPPFLGFLPKWLTVNQLILNEFFLLATILIMFSLITLFFYLRITFTSFTLNTSESLTFNLSKMKYSYFLINFMSLSGLMFCSLMTNFY